MKIFRIILQIVLLLSFSQSFACDCDTEKTLKDLRDRSYQYAELIFLAEVISYDSTTWSYVLRITETLKGDSTIKTIGGAYYDSCSKVLTGEGTWLVYGRLRADGRISIDQCGATRSDVHPQVILRDYDEREKRNADEQYKQALKDWNEEIEMLRNK